MQNSRLIDEEQRVFSVLDIVNIALFEGYQWQGEDIKETTAVGSVFHAYENPPTQSVASLTVVDVTSDASEPDISQVEQADVQEIDEQLRAAVAVHFDLVRWMSSKLNQAATLKALVTLYITNDAGAQWQYIALRLSTKGRKLVVIGMFDVAKSDVLAGAVYQTMQNISLS
jgi:hypothetical protein